MEDGEDCLESRSSRLLVLIDRDTTAIIIDSDGVVTMEDGRDGTTVTSECFIDTIIDDLLDHMVESFDIRRSDIHSWSLADWLESLEDFDRGGIVCSGGVEGFGVRHRVMNSETIK